MAREIRRQLEAAGHRVGDYRIVPDEPALVRAAVEELGTSGRIEVVLVSGGRGIAARDNTCAAVSALLSKRIDGFGELFRMLSFEEIGSASMISRAVGGLVGTMALFSMPGSTAACRLAMEKLIVPQLTHVVGLARETQQDVGVLDRLRDAIVEGKLALDGVLPAPEILGDFGMAPEVGARHLDFELGELGTQAGFVKDAPGIHRNAGAGRGCAPPAR